MALENRKHFYTIASDSVDNSIGAFEHLANVVATELGNPPPGHRCASGTFGGSYKHTDPSRSGDGVISGNEVADRLEIGERSIRPDYGEGLR
jgi:hypothetical protein